MGCSCPDYPRCYKKIGIKKILGKKASEVDNDNTFSRYPDHYSELKVGGKVYTTSLDYYHGQQSSYKKGYLKKLFEFALKCKDKKKKKNLADGRKALGVVLHAMQDSYAHASGPNSNRYDKTTRKYTYKKGFSLNVFEKNIDVCIKMIRIKLSI